MSAARFPGVAASAQTNDLFEPFLRGTLASIERELGTLLELEDERGMDRLWSEAITHAQNLATRPGKRVRPMLVILGHALVRPGANADPGLLRIAAATELLHAFLLVHDDVADRSELRRGAPTLHRLLGDGRLGEDLAIVSGDHLFARAIEVMLESGHPLAAQAARYTLQICRHTAVGQFMDLSLARAPLAEVTLFQALKVANLKTARYGFVAPLVTGALLGGGLPETTELLSRIGRNAGVAFQLKDDLLGLFGDAAVTGKPDGADLAEGKRTFPVIAAYVRANDADRAELEALWEARSADPASLARARALIEQNGGREATERLISRTTRSAMRALQALPAGAPRSLLERTVGALSKRHA